MNIEKEADEYATYWNDEESKQKFRIGCCNFVTRPATVFAVEAARCMW